MWFKGEWTDTAIYAILRGEWEAWRDASRTSSQSPSGSTTWSNCSPLTPLASAACPQRQVMIDGVVRDLAARR